MTPGHVPVLLYHSVNDVPPPGMARFTLTPALLREHAMAIVASGRTPLTMSALADGLRGRTPLPDAPVVITFDDGYDDTLSAVATLLEHGLPSTTYIQTGRLGTAGWLDANGVRALDALGDGAEIGAHTIDHPRVDELAGAALEREVRGSKEALEQILGSQVVGFAYPHGAHDVRSRAAVVAAGYRHAAAVKNALSHPHDDPYAIARWTVEAGTPASRIQAMLDGEDVPIAWRGDRAITTAYRRVRRWRRRLTGARA